MKRRTRSETHSITAQKPITHVVPQLKNNQILLPIEIISSIYQYAIQIKCSNPRTIMKIDKHALNEMRKITLKTLTVTSNNKAKMHRMLDFIEWSTENRLRTDFNEFTKNLHVYNATGAFINALHEYTSHSPLHLDVLEFDVKEKKESQKFLSTIVTVRHLIVASQFANFLSSSVIESIVKVTVNRRSNEPKDFFEFLNKCPSLKTLDYTYIPLRQDSVDLIVKLESLRMHIPGSKCMSFDYFAPMVQSSDSLVELKIDQDSVYNATFNSVHLFNTMELLMFPNLRILCVSNVCINMANLLLHINHLEKLTRLELINIEFEIISLQQVEDLFSIALSGRPLVDITLKFQNSAMFEYMTFPMIRNGRRMALAKYSQEKRALLKFVINDENNRYFDMYVRL